MFRLSGGPDLGTPYTFSSGNLKGEPSFPTVSLGASVAIVLYTRSAAIGNMVSTDPEFQVFHTHSCNVCKLNVMDRLRKMLAYIFYLCGMLNLRHFALFGGHKSILTRTVVNNGRRSRNTRDRRLLVQLLYADLFLNLGS